MRRILLIEDDKNLGILIEDRLRSYGYEVVRKMDGEAGLNVYQATRFDLCLVDVMLPRMDGFTFAREVRKKDLQIPLIFLTARSMQTDKIEGFTIGADDYITKPFTMEELELRIQAVLKRSLPSTTRIPDSPRFGIGIYVFDYERRQLISPASEQKLTTREAELLRLLCLHMNRLLDRKLALDTIWGDDSYFNGRSMDVFISRLRRRLKEDASVEIMNIHGKGFKLIAEPSQLL